MCVCVFVCVCVDQQGCEALTWRELTFGGGKKAHCLVFSVLDTVKCKCVIKKKIDFLGAFRVRKQMVLVTGVFLTLINQFFLHNLV